MRKGQRLKHQIKEDEQSLAREEQTSKVNLGRRADFRSFGMDKKIMDKRRIGVIFFSFSNRFFISAQTVPANTKQSVPSSAPALPGINIKITTDNIVKNTVDIIASFCLNFRSFSNGLTPGKTVSTSILLYFVAKFKSSVVFVFISFIF